MLRLCSRPSCGGQLLQDHDGAAVCLLCGRELLRGPSKPVQLDFSLQDENPRISRGQGRKRGRSKVA
jgi:hypothetical protein